MDAHNIGGLFMVGFHGTELSAEVKDLLEDLAPCGVILFSRNIEDPAQIAELNHDIQSHGLLQGGAGYFIGVDQEGGRVRRLQHPFAAFPPAAEMATTPGSEKAVEEFARITARQLRLVGFNVDFVPILDVLTSEDAHCSGVIGDRSFGSDPRIVARLGRIVIDVMRSEGVIPCCKHYPGHGGTSVDSHATLPVDARPWDEIRSCDLLPFQDAVDRGVDMVMTAHVLYPAIDPVLPATLSPGIVQGVLRSDMGYSGVVITDDLDMGAVSRSYSIEECALRAVTAGDDILLICNHPEKAFAARSRILQAIRDGELSEERVRDSLARIGDLKRKYGSSMKPCAKEAVHDYFDAV